MISQITWRDSILLFHYVVGHELSWKVSTDLAKLKAKLKAIQELRCVIGFNAESSENMDFLS